MIQEVIINSENSFIGAWILPDLSICDNLINFFETSSNTCIGEILLDNKSVVVKTTKDSIDLPLTLDYPVTQPYLDALQFAVEEYKKKYKWATVTSPWRVEAVNLQKYNPGGAYFNWHSERQSGGPIAGNRHLVFMTYLNDVTEDGETEFFYQKVKVKPQKGLTLIWPVDWTHTHRGCPSMTQTKYIATGWFRFTD